MADEELRLVVRSDGVWNLNNRSNEGDSFVQDGTVSEFLNLNEGGSNEITLVAFDEVGLFFLNGHLISKLDLSGQNAFGEVALGTGFYSNNKQAGEVLVTRILQFGRLCLNLARVMARWNMLMMVSSEYVTPM